jgi:Tol biopolymer transport system component
MTAAQRLERDLPLILDEIGMGPYPDYVDDVLSTTARGRQRPGWTFPERWFPMDLVTTRVPQTRLPWRQLGVLALIAILLAAALAIYVGSQTPTPLPAPFGPAKNGLIAYDTDGDISVVDARTGEKASIVATPDVDRNPRYSRDGSRIVFQRVTNTGSRLFVYDAKASTPVEITSEPLRLTQPLQNEPWEQYQFSPDGRSVVIAATVDGIASMFIAQSDGSGIRRLDVGMPAYEPSFRPPDGSEILFAGLVGDELGVHAVDPSTNAVRTIIVPTAGYGLAGPNWSPDGSQIAYWRWGGQTELRLNAHTRVIRSDGTGDRELPGPSDAVWNAGSEWSNDGTRIALVREYTDDYSNVHGVVAPADGSTTGIELHFDGTLNGDCCAAFEWSPDDQSILVTPAAAGGRPMPQVLIDVATGRSQPASWESTSDPTWQRLAP